MIRGSSDPLKRIIAWTILSLIGFFSAHIVPPRPQLLGALAYTFYPTLFVLGCLLGVHAIDLNLRCRHSRLSPIERVLNTISIQRFVFSSEELIFFLCGGITVGLAHQVIVLGGLGYPPPMFLQACVGVLVVGFIFGARADTDFCLSCNQHHSRGTAFRFKPLTNPDHPNIPTRCRSYAEDVAGWLGDWLVAPENEGGIVVLDGAVGSGKSTFKNLVLSFLTSRKKDVITVEISAWETLGEKELQRRILSEIISVLDNHYALGSYKHSWTSMLDSLAKGEPRLSPIFWAAANISTEDYLKEWRSVFLALNHRVVVVIEDLERFSSKELFAILRIIDELREFPNLTFFIPTDLSECLNLLNHSPDQDLPIDRSSVLQRTLGGRTIQVFAPNADERLDILMSRFSDVGNEWVAGL